MGTRNITFVIHEGKVRMAQYGQFDGYPTGVGCDISKVLRDITVGEIREAIGRCVFIDDETVQRYWLQAGADGSGFVTLEVSNKFKEAYPLLSREASGGYALEKILQTHTPTIELSDASEFAGDSLFCEWGYVVDLDKEIVEVYKGFNHDPLPADARFAKLIDKPKVTSDGTTYYPIRLLRTYSISEFMMDGAMKDLEAELSAQEEA